MNEKNDNNKRGSECGAAGATAKVAKGLQTVDSSGDETVPQTPHSDNEPEIHRQLTPFVYSGRSAGVTTTGATTTVAAGAPAPAVSAPPRPLLMVDFEFEQYLRSQCQEEINKRRTEFHSQRISSVCKG